MLDGKTCPAEQVPRDPDWHSWSKVTLRRTLTKGRHTVKVWFDSTKGSTNFLNLDNLTVKTG